MDHYLLLDRLHAIGLSQHALLWFNSYLRNRKQCVVLRGCKSDLLTQQRGVPQGSTLGPLLFSIFTNDLLPCYAQLYADDTIIYTSKPSTSQIQEALQSDFNTLQTWLLVNKLMLNKLKTSSMLFGVRQNLNSKSNFLVLRCNNGEHLQKEDKIKYLGMLIDSELTFRPHTLVLVSFIVQGIVLHLKSERDSSPHLFYQSLVMLRVRFAGGEGGDFPPVWFTCPTLC